MPQISMTTFLDYIAATGTTRLRRISDAKKHYGQEYNPATDFYGPLRKRIVQTFEDGWDPNKFDVLLAEVTDPKKHDLYGACRNGLRKWAGVSGKKTIVWQAPKKVIWKSGDLEVNVSPELWVAVDGGPEIIKLYFKSDKLTQHKVNLSLRLLETTVGGNGTAVGILDLQRGKLFQQTTEPPDGIDLLLQSEAAGLATLWNSLP
ncbi:hypothetical protein [Capillimicrobium parvum]|uniref:Uncharacterized protein n=1 Tax=Capillimicrobium parvum TaxID=2884022 RepID=A0A9E7BZU6_9ACTN|nr:hypothetical protein [Capillimicrobium parvum]UGS34708.1 hypothetical protein DSM104329_01090 [Capillimicrobium parvum]